jgi:hypothetical protein
MLEILLGKGATLYDFKSPSTVLFHMDGTPGTQAGTGTASIGLTEEHGPHSAGIYSSAKLTNQLTAFGTTAVDCSGAATSVFFCNASRVGEFVHSGDFTAEVYLGKKNAALSRLNPIFCDRYSPDLTTSFPNNGYPPAGTYSSSILMSCYLMILANGNLGLSLKGLTGSGSTWYTAVLDTGVNIWNLLSTTSMKLFLFQMRSKVFEVYLDGKKIYSVANPAWAGPGYNSQLDLGNNWTLNGQATDLLFDEFRYTNGLARVLKGSAQFPLPTKAFSP